MITTTQFRPVFDGDAVDNDLSQPGGVSNIKNVIAAETPKNSGKGASSGHTWIQWNRTLRSQPALDIKPDTAFKKNGTSAMLSCDTTGDLGGQLQSLSLDKIAPTITVAVDATSLTAGETAALNFFASEESFNFAGSANSYQATLTEIQIRANSLNAIKQTN